jgi:two-component system OmpR family sensor kinase
VRGRPRHGHAGRHRFHGRHCDVPRQKRLQHRLFLWFGATIALTALAVGTVSSAFGPGAARWQEQLKRFETLAARELVRNWDDPRALGDLTLGLAEAFQAGVTVRDARGHVRAQAGAPCEGGYRLELRREGVVLGSAYGCVEHRARAPLGFLFGLVTAVGVLWAASFAIARRLTRPLAELERVTRAIGSGDLGARVRLGRHQPGEVGALSDSVNEMAARIERQLREERELLAAVSHELRSPLARMRMLVELAQGEASAERLRELEAEIVGIDSLLGKLLASSRLEFGALAKKKVSALDLARRALDAVGLPAELLRDESQGAELEVDPTLVGRALGNLLENAVHHGGGAEALTVRRLHGAPPRVSFEVTDGGPGFGSEALGRAFEPFYSAETQETPAEGTTHGLGLGLGLSLVARIARAHGGRAHAENRPQGGARTVLELPASGAP